MTVSQIRQTISPAAVLLRYDCSNLELKSHASGIINKLEYDSAYTNKVRLRNFLWTISVMCSYFVPPACYNYTSDCINNYIHVTVP